jgi:hypothetical protein
MKKRIEQSERERKELAGIKKLANERAKKANLHNKKLRDCRVHLNDEPPAKGKQEFFAKLQKKHHLHYRRRFGQRFHYQSPRCRYPGRVQPAW